MLKVRIMVSDENKEYVTKLLLEHGIEISDDSEYVITDISPHPGFLDARDDKKEKVRIATEDVICIEAFGKDIEIHTAHGTYYAMDRMYSLEETLNPHEFLRISKSVIISGKHVKKIKPTFSMKYVLTLTNGMLVDVTRSYYSEFRRFFGIE